MKRWRLLIALGVVAYIVFAVITLPARVVLSRLAPSDVHAGGVSGTIWNGKAQVLAVRGVRVGALEWDLHVLPLFTGRLVADLKVTRVDGFLQSKASLSPSGRIRLSDLAGSAPLAALPADVNRGGWTGTVNMRLASLILENAWPVEAEGVVEVVDVAGPASKPVNMGSYRATFPENAATDGQLKADVVDLGGPLSFAGTLTLRQADRSYHIEGMIAARPDAPTEVVNALRFLGPADADGRRPFGTEGTL